MKQNLSARRATSSLLSDASGMTAPATSTATSSIGREASTAPFGPNCTVPATAPLITGDPIR